MGGEQWEKVLEISATVKGFFFYKIADRVGSTFTSDTHENELVIIALLISTIFMVQYIEMNITELIEGRNVVTGGVLRALWAPIALVGIVLEAIVLWLGQLLAVVVGNYITAFAGGVDAFGAVPITLAVGGFLLLARFVINPPPSPEWKRTTGQ